MESKSTSSALSLTLVALLAGGALYPHISEFGSGAGRQGGGTAPAPPLAARAAGMARSQSAKSSSQSPVPVAGLATVEGNVTTATDLLAEHYGVDIHSERLKDYVKNAASRLGDDQTATSADASRHLSRPIDVLNAFLHLELHDYGRQGDLDRARHAIETLNRSVSAPISSTDPNVKTVRAFVEQYLDDDVLHDDVATFTQLRDRRNADRQKLQAKDFDSVDKEPLAAEILRSWASPDRLTFMIATVPDPLDSQQAWRFDPYVAAIREGVEDSGFLFDRAFFPDTQAESKTEADTRVPRTRHEQWPGIILFRAKAAAPKALYATSVLAEPLQGERPLQRDVTAEADVLVTFLVYETPTAGIHVEAFQRAAKFAIEWSRRDANRKMPDEPTLRVLGPAFSGSSASLAVAIRNVIKALALNDKNSIRVVSGSATNFANQAIVQNAALVLKETDSIGVVSGPTTNSANQAFVQHSRPVSVQFKATVLPDDVLDASVRTFLCGRGVRRIAKLIETGTGFGANAGKSIKKTNDCEEPTIFSFPYGISKLRSDSANELKVTDGPSSPLTARPLALEDLPTGSDQFPIVTPSITSPMVELSLTALLETVRREGFGAIGIAATDERDVLFLANRIRFYAPNVIVYALWGSLLFSHSDALASTSGLVEVSPYPLHPSAQLWSLRSGLRLSGDARRLQFANMSAEGVYNAAIALLDYREDGTLAARFDVRSEHPSLRDYMVKPTNPLGQSIDQPSHLLSVQGSYERSIPGLATWISVASRGTVWPVAAYTIDDLDQANRASLKKSIDQYVFQPAATTASASLMSEAVFPSIAALAVSASLLIVTVILAGVALVGSRDRTFEAWRALLFGSLGILLILGPTSIIWERTTLAEGSASALGVALIAALLVLLCIAGACSRFMWRSYSNRGDDTTSTTCAWIASGSLVVGSIVASVFAAWTNSVSAGMFGQRALEIGNGVSPLVPVLIFGAVPCLLALCELGRLWTVGGLRTTGENRARASNSTWRIWTKHGQHLLDALIGPSAVALSSATDNIRIVRASLFGLPIWGLVAVAGSTIMMGASVFTSQPIVSVEGRAFGVAVAAFLLVAQASLVLGAIQHFCLWRACERVLSRLTWEPLRSALERLGRDNRMMAHALMPRPVALVDLQPMVDIAKDHDVGIFSASDVIVKSMNRDLNTRKYWLESDTWKTLAESVCTFSDEIRCKPRGVSLSRALGHGAYTDVFYSMSSAGISASSTVERPVSAIPVVVSDAGSPDDRRADLAAIASGLLIRDILGRLAITRVLVGGCFFMLMALYVSFTFQNSHRLLGVIWCDGVAVMALMIGVTIRMEQNELLSLMNNTAPGRIDWNTETVTRFLLYGVAPLIALLGAQFPQLAVTLFRWFEPIQRLP